MSTITDTLMQVVRLVRSGGSFGQGGRSDTDELRFELMKGLV